LYRVHVALCLRSYVPETGVLVQALSVEDLQYPDIALVVAPAREIDVFPGRALGMGLGVELLGVVIERLESAMCGYKLEVATPTAAVAACN